MYKIKYKSLEACINPIGAELSSLQNNGAEFIWQGDEKIWNGRAPILFPIVGSLKDNTMTHLGNKYTMPRHGIARRATFECLQHSDAEVTMSLKADDATRSVYPWNFELQVHFEISDSGIEIRYDIFNRGHGKSDNGDMLFTIGSHPAFALQLDDTYQLSDYAITFNQAEDFASHALNSDGLIATEATPIKTTDNAIVLSEDVFNNDALVFRDINSTTISLQRGGNTLLSVDTGGAPHLGIWSKPGAPFVCIEPWLGTSDFVDASGDFAAKPDLKTLAANQKFSSAIKISLH